GAEARCHEGRTAPRRVRAAGRRGGSVAVSSRCARRRGLRRRPALGGGGRGGAAHREIPAGARNLGAARREDTPHPRRCLRLSHHHPRRGGGAHSMNSVRLLAVARKEMIHILRDTRSLIIVVIMPVTLMLLFGYGVNL